MRASVERLAPRRRRDVHKALTDVEIRKAKPGPKLGELFKRLAGIEMTHVPYRGSATAIGDLIAGRVDVMFDNITFMLPQVQGGQARGLAVTSKERVPAAPEFPTVIEAGLAGFEVTSWFGVTAPARTPPALVAKLNEDTVKVMNQPAVREKFEKLGARVATTTPEGFGAYMREETARWGKLIKEVGIKLDG